MSMSQFLYTTWVDMCAADVGKLLMPTGIEPGKIFHDVPPGSPPLVTPAGEVIRRVTLFYSLEDNSDEYLQ